MSAGACRVAVVGGGLSGLATAWYLRRDMPDAEVVVFEGSERLGGKLFTGALAGQPFDMGADAFLARQPEFEELCRQLGLADDLVAPMDGQVWMWLEDGVKPLPRGTTLGVPSDFDELEASGILTEHGLSRARGEAYLGPPQLGPNEDPNVAEFVAQRFGPEVVARLVDPLLSGIYAGDTSKLGLRSAAPAIAKLADEAVAAGCTMSEMAGRRRLQPSTDGPVFLTVEGGLSRVIDALAIGLDVRLGSHVNHLSRVERHWQVDGEAFDAVVMAAPAWEATKVVATAVPALATMLDRITYAGATVVALAYPKSTELPQGSGMLVPRSSQRLLKAATWSSRKWLHLAARDEVVLRCSMGRIDDHRHDLLGDDDVIAATRRELAESIGLEVEPIDAVVTRWPRALAQYESGHRERVAEMHAAANQAGLVLTGAAYEGVGLPACVRQARTAATRVAAVLDAA